MLASKSSDDIEYNECKYQGDSKEIFAICEYIIYTDYWKSAMITADETNP